MHIHIYSYNNLPNTYTMFAPKVQKDCPIRLVLSEVLLNQFYSGI